MKKILGVTSKVPYLRRVYNLKLDYDNLKLEHNNLKLNYDNLKLENDNLKTGYDDIRYFVSNKYIAGYGIEIGALQNPLKYNKEKATVKYVDRLPLSELRKQYPELKNLDLVNPDYIDDGEVLSSFECESLDFIIANHMLEHCKNPIKTIQNHLRKIKSNGILYYAIPDKQFTPDASRDLTSIEHLVEDYYERNSHKEHYVEWVKSWNKVKDKKQIESKVNNLLKIDYSIHFHTWTSDSFIEFILFLRNFKPIKDQFRIELSIFNEKEVIVILRKM